MRRLGGAGARLVLRDDAVVNLLEVLLHLVRSGELLLTHGARKHLPIVTLVIEERVPLETVLVLKALDNLDLLALNAPVGAVARDVGVLEQVKAPDAHVLETLGLRPGLRGQVAPGAGVAAGALEAGAALGRGRGHVRGSGGGRGGGLTRPARARAGAGAGAAYITHKTVGGNLQRRLLVFGRLPIDELPTGLFMSHQQTWKKN